MKQSLANLHLGQSTLGYRPLVSFTDGLEPTVEWHQIPTRWLIRLYLLIFLDLKMRRLMGVYLPAVRSLFAAVFPISMYKLAPDLLSTVLLVCLKIHVRHNSEHAIGLYPPARIEFQDVHFLRVNK